MVGQEEEIYPYARDAFSSISSYKGRWTFEIFDRQSRSGWLRGDVSMFPKLSKRQSSCNLNVKYTYVTIKSNCHDGDLSLSVPGIQIFGEGGGMIV